MGQVEFPCYECAEREPRCHAVCEKYIAKKEQWNRLKHDEIGRAADAIVIEAIMKVKRKTNFR